jgi:hypothetical protein
LPVETIIEALAEATDDEEIAKRVAVVKATSKELAADKLVTGWPTLAEALGNDGEAIIAEFRRLLGLTITLADFAEVKHLPLDFLLVEVLHNLTEGGIGIPYKDISSETLVVKSLKSSQLEAIDRQDKQCGRPS